MNSVWQIRTSTGTEIVIGRYVPVTLILEASDLYNNTGSKIYKYHGMVSMVKVEISVPDPDPH
jgi:hypothetical protein